MTWSGKGTDRSPTTSMAHRFASRPLDEGPGPGPDGRLEGPDHRRLEAGLHQPPVAGVGGRVGVHHRRR